MRQKRDKNGPGPEYRHIPRDGSGEPVFFILPDGVRESYDRKMASCEAGWLATGDPWAVAEAHTLAHLHRQAAPTWLDDAVWMLANKSRTKEHAKRAREAAIRLMRYQAVRDAKPDRRTTWDEAYERAARVLAGTPATAPPDKMRQVYIAVKKDLKAKRNGRYFTPKKQNRSSLNRSSAGEPNGSAHPSTATRKNPV